MSRIVRPDIDRSKSPDEIRRDRNYLDTVDEIWGILRQVRMKMLASLALWFLFWEAVGRAKFSTIVPPFSAVVEASIELLPSAKFQHAAIISLRSFALGMGLALAVGIPLGIAMARVKSIGRILGMWVNIFVSAPISRWCRS